MSNHEQIGNVGHVFLSPVVYGRAGDADVIVQSCDGVQFHLHRKYLHFNSEGFPPAEIDTYGEVVVLSENASTLELLFQYIYPQHHPELRNISFEDLASLAEAAEKYGIYSAMIVSKIRMRYLTTFPVIFFSMLTSLMV